MQMSEVWAAICGHVTFKDHTAAGALLLWVACTATRDNGDIQICLLLRTMLERVILLEPESACVATKGHKDIWVENCGFVGV